MNQSSAQNPEGIAPIYDLHKMRDKLRPPTPEEEQRKLYYRAEVELFEDLLQPERVTMHGEKLAERVTVSLSMPRNDSETLPIQETLLELTKVEQKRIEMGDVSDDNYYEKLKTDPVFATIITTVQAYSGNNYTLKRAALRLSELRLLSIEDETHLDPAWLDVLSRIFR